MNWANKYKETRRGKKKKKREKSNLYSLLYESCMSLYLFIIVIAFVFPARDSLLLFNILFYYYIYHHFYYFLMCDMYIQHKKKKCILSNKFNHFIQENAEE